MRKSSTVSAKLFKAVCLSFSIIMLVLSLLYHVRIISAEERIARLEEETELAMTEADILKVKLENRISLAELERIATEKLGMHRPTPEQLFFCDLE